MVEHYNYQYDIYVKLECEHCDNTFVRHDVLKTTYSETKDSLMDMYENAYEGELNEEMPHCNKCNNFMFETEIVKLKEKILNPKKEVANEIE
ncbi:MAG: hypothetical protein Q4G05_01610 [Clostridia bacterium]|nr:hypothetical protein [Clostridia bacterium]